MDREGVELMFDDWSSGGMVGDANARPGRGCVSVKVVSILQVDPEVGMNKFSALFLSVLSLYL